MAISEAKRKANQKWDSANMATLACKVKREQAAQFRTYCEGRGETVNAALQGFVSLCTGDNKTPCDTSEYPVSDFAPLVEQGDIEQINAHITQTGEVASEFVKRAIADTIKRDAMLLKMGMNPAGK